MKVRIKPHAGMEITVFGYYEEKVYRVLVLVYRGDPRDADYKFSSYSERVVDRMTIEPHYNQKQRKVIMLRLAQLWEIKLSQQS